MPAPHNLSRSFSAQKAVLPEVLLDFDAGQALNEQLTQALRQAIAQGVLRAGIRLPPSREAAQQLGLGRNTVVDAYAQLFAEGLIETRGRHGSFVTASPSWLKSSPSVLKAQMPAAAIKRLHPTKANERTAITNWRLGQACVQLLPLRVWRAASKEAGRHLPPADYGDPRGLLALRTAIAYWLRKERGVHYEAQQIIVTQGAGTAIDLLMALLLRPGDVGAVECPGYLRAAAAVQSAGARLREVAVDAEGMLVHQAFEGKAPTLVHFTPSHQYPMGGRLSGARRRVIAQLALKHHSLLIENEYDHEFIHEGKNHTPVAASLPSLRLGFVAAPQEVADALASKIERERLHVSWPVQCTVQWLLQSGEMQKHLRRVRRYYALLRADLLKQLAQKCPRLRISGHAGGLHLVIRCEKPTQTKLLMSRLQRQGVMFNRLKDFGGREDALLLAYGHMSESDIKHAVLTLAACNGGG
jgi:GntR family transcriptional regulator / MocR family aminotransferase